MKRVYLTEGHKRFIQDNHLKMGSQDLAAIIGCSKCFIRRYMKDAGIIVPKHVSRGFAIAKMTGKSKATPEQDEIIHRDYLKFPVKALAVRLGISDTMLRTRLRQLCLVIPEDLIQKRKDDSRIKVGNVPINKGKKQAEYMSPEQIAKTEKTRFKKGQKIHNEAFDGAIRIRVNHPERNGGRPIKYIRISKGKWKELQAYNWENKYGPIPKGSILACLDGDTLNCDSDNWKIISKAENAIRNAGHTNLPDVYVAGLIARKGKKVDQELRRELLEHPGLLEIKRQSLLLNKEIKNHGKSGN